jgi:hypothetical protein
VRDVRVVHNSSGRAEAVRVLTGHGWRRLAGRTVETDFKLGSADFDIRALTLNPPSPRLVFGSRLRLTGYVRGLGRARLQQVTDRGWVTLRPIHVLPDGTFAAYLAPKRSTSYRLAYNGVSGDPVSVDVVPHVSLVAQNGLLHVVVAPDLPMVVERLQHAQWRSVGVFHGTLARRLLPGSYRVSVPGRDGYLRAVSHAVTIRA